MLGLENPVHLLFLLAILLLLFGAKRLPEMGKSLGSGIRGFRDSLGGHDHDAPAAAELTATPAAAVTTPAPGAADAAEHSTSLAA